MRFIVWNSNHDIQLLSTHLLFLKEDIEWQKYFHSFYDDNQYVEYIKKSAKKSRRKLNRVIIENDVWIGLGVTALEGVHIGDGAVIAAGSVVTKDVSAYSVVCGGFAKIVKMRFQDEVIAELKKILWWDYGPDIINGLDITRPNEIVKELRERKLQFDEKRKFFHSRKFIFDSASNTITGKGKDGYEILLYSFKK